MIINEPKAGPQTELERQELARSRAAAKINQDAVEKELQLMAEEDRARAAAEATRIESAQRAEGLKITRLAGLRALYGERSDLAQEVVSLVSRLVSVEVTLRKEQLAILGRPRSGSHYMDWLNYVARLRTSAGLTPTHEQLGMAPPVSPAESIGMTAVHAIVEDFIGPAWVRSGEHFTQWDFSRGS